MTQPKKLSFAPFQQASPAGAPFVSWTPSYQTLVKAPTLDTALILSAAEIAAEFGVAETSHTGSPPDLAQIRAGLNKLAV